MPYYIVRVWGTGDDWRGVADSEAFDDRREAERTARRRVLRKGDGSRGPTGFLTYRVGWGETRQDAVDSVVEDERAFWADSIIFACGPEHISILDDVLPSRAPDE